MTVFAVAIALIVAILAVLFMRRVVRIGRFMDRHSYFKTGRCKIFVSYKSQNSRQACQIAEELISQGQTVWIDQYKIPLDERLGGSQFIQYLDKGMALCTKAVLLTNRLYSKSEWCLYEAKGILGQYPIANLIEVHIPNDHDLYAPDSQLPPSHQKSLRDIGKIEWSGSATDVVVAMADLGL